MRGGDRLGVRRAHERVWASWRTTAPPCDVMRLAVSLSHSPAMIRVNVVATSHRPRVSEFGHVEAQTSPSTWACMRRRSVEEATRTSSIVAYPTACVRALEVPTPNSRWWSVSSGVRLRACALYSVRFRSYSECTRASSEFSSQQFTTSWCVLWRLNRCNTKQSEHTAGGLLDRPARPLHQSSVGRSSAGIFTGNLPLLPTEACFRPPAASCLAS